MSNFVNETPSSPKYVEIYRGAPEPFIFRRLFNGVYKSFDSSLTCVVTPPSGTPFTLSVGAGITLSTYNSVASAMVTLQLSEAQSNLLPKGSLSNFVFLQVVNSIHVPVLTGSFIGTGV